MGLLCYFHYDKPGSRKSGLAGSTCFVPSLGAQGSRDGGPRQDELATCCGWQRACGVLSCGQCTHRGWCHVALPRTVWFRDVAMGACPARSAPEVGFQPAKHPHILSHADLTSHFQPQSLRPLPDTSPAHGLL